MTLLYTMLGVMGRHLCTAEPLLGSAADPHANGHEGPEGATALHHGLPDATHQLTTPHSDP